MEYKYIVYTSIPRDFDPEVEGETLDSIVGSCDGILDWSVPLVDGKTKILMTLDRKLDWNYLVKQLSTEFRDCGGKENVVLRIVKQQVL